MTATTAHERRYTIRYRGRSRRGQTALIVEDGQGRAYLFSGGWLQGRLSGNKAAHRLAAIMAGHASWRIVPKVRPYSIAGLRQLVGLPATEQNHAKQLQRLTA